MLAIDESSTASRLLAGFGWETGGGGVSISFRGAGGVILILFLTAGLVSDLVTMFEGLLLGPNIRQQQQQQVELLFIDDTREITSYKLLLLSR